VLRVNTRVHLIFKAIDKDRELFFDPRLVSTADTSDRTWSQQIILKLMSLPEVGAHSALTQATFDLHDRTGVSVVPVENDKGLYALFENVVDKPSKCV
jgi:hypothetical protein